MADGKRTAVLVAAVAVLIVSTALMGQWRQAQADHEGVPEFSKEIQGGETVYDIGEEITFVISMANVADGGIVDGNSVFSVGNMEISDTLPDALEYVSHQTSNTTSTSLYTCSVSGQEVTCSNSVGGHSAVDHGGGTETIEITARVAEEFQPGNGVTDDVTNTATYDYSGGSSVSGSDSVDLTILASNISASLTAEHEDSPLGRGSEVSYEFEISNDDTENVTDAPQGTVEFDADFNAAATNIEVEGDGIYECSVSGSHVDCSNSDGAHGVDENYTIGITVTVAQDAEFDSLELDAIVTSASSENDVPFEIDIPVESSQLSLEKSLDLDTVDEGREVTFTLEVSNAGGTDVAAAPQGSVAVTDTLPGVFEDISAVPQSAGNIYDCSVSGQDVSCTNSGGDHEDGDTYFIDVTATVAPDVEPGDYSNNAVLSTFAQDADAEGDAGFLVQFTEGLFHLDQWGDALWTDDGELERDDANNVLGSEHAVCVGGLDTGDEMAGIVDSGTASGGPDDFFWRIDTLSGDTSVNGQQMITVTLDGEGNADPDGDEYECVRWYSTGAGEQNVTIVNGQGETIADFGVVDYDGATNDTPLVKEWNVLDPTAITYRDEDGEDEDNNLDGTEVGGSAVFDPSDGIYRAETVEFDEHVFGSHTSLGGEWEGLVDGADVTFTVSGTCGVLTVDPDGSDTLEGTSSIGASDDGASITVTSTGQPIGFDVDTGDAASGDECTNGDGDFTTVTINAGYPTDIGSVPAEGAPQEEVTVAWDAPTTPTKDIFLAWAGQRVMLDHNWSLHSPGEDDYASPGECPYHGDFLRQSQDDEATLGQDAIYVKGGGPGNFVTGENTTFEGADAARTSVNEDCLTEVVYESEDQGEVNVELFIEGSAASKFAFVIYYMKLENIELDALDNGEDGIANSNHNESGADWTPGNPWDLEGSDVSSNVSEDVLVRARVKGWFTTSNPSGRDRGEDDENNILPADRWVMPDDWSRLTAGTSDPSEAYDRRPDADLMFSPASGMYLANPLGTIFGEEGDEEEDTEIGRSFTGPYSLVDVPERGVGVAPEYPVTELDEDEEEVNNFRDTSLGDGQVDWWDAPMPAAEVTFSANGSGFIKEVLKKDVYYEGEAEGDQVYTNPYYYTHIPGHPDIPAAAAGGGYEWNTWGGDGAYEFWNAVNVNDGDITGDDADELDDIRDAYGDETIGREISVYSDNHGEAFVAANGDFNLSYADCDTNLLGGGQHCDDGDVVGETEIDALADYPDFVGNHPPVGAAETATIEWTWGGYKEVTVEPGETEQFVYVVFRALDRDGYCGVPEGVTSLHPVLSSADAENDIGSHDPVENIDFLIDSDEGGVFINTSGGSLGSDNKFASGLDTYSTADEDRSEDATDASRSFAPLNDGAEECQAWVKISNSLLGVTNVITVAHDDEGDIGFDNIVDFQDEHEYTLNFRWSLITWMGADGISPSDAISGEGENDGGDDISDQVTAIYGWQADSQDWLAYFPSGADIPGANDLAELEEGDAYWIAIEGPEAITWTVMTDVD